MLPIEGQPIAGGAVCVDDGWIVDVGALADVRGRNVEAPVVDLGEAILAPGFVDAHAHLEWSLMDGVLPSQPFAAWLGRLLGLRGRMEPEDHLVAARHGALRALRAGTTTLADSGPTGAAVIAMAEAGLRGPVHLEAFGREEGDEARALASGVAERVAALAAAADPRNRVGLSPHAPYTVGPALWAALAEVPYLAGRPWATHLAESDDETRVIAGGDGALTQVFDAIGAVPGRWPGAEGAGPVERLGRSGCAEPRGSWPRTASTSGTGTRPMLARAGVGVAHCPRSNEYLHCGRAPVTALREAGVPVGLGTDSPASGGDYDVRAEARACARIHGEAAGTPEALLALATIGGARVLGLDAEVGSLVPGKRADLVALRAPPGLSARPLGGRAGPRERGDHRGRGWRRGAHGWPARGHRRGRGRDRRHQSATTALVASETVLLDQKRTKRTVQVVAILTSLAFGGVIIVVLGLIFFGGGSASPEDQLLSDAKARVQQEPSNPDAWEQLASAYRATDDLPQAVAAAEKALSFAPNDFGRVQVLISLQLDAGNSAGAIAALSDFTVRNPNNADAFLQLGQQAQEAGRTQLARLSYEAFLRLAPDDSNAAAVRERLKELAGTGAQTAPAG